MASTNIQRVHTSAPTDNKKCTISVWVKRGVLNGTNSSSGIYGGLNAAWNAAGNVQIGFMNDKAYCWFKTANGDRKKQESTRVFRDTNAWYHFVYRIDTTQGTASDRIRVYCNNEELTSWGSTADPTSSEDIAFTTNGYTNYIGKFNWTNGGVNYFDGILSHFHLCDGYSYAPTEFGETDSTTGEWKIKTSPNVNYGNNGYFILKDGSSLTDQSGQGNNWSTHNGTLTKTEDCPSNVFAVLDSNNITLNGTSTYSCGNTKFKNSSSSWGSGISTLMPTSGKWYFESQVTDNTGSKFIMGICDMDKYPEWRWQSSPYFGTRGYSYYSDGAYLGTNSSGSTNQNLGAVATTSVNDYIGMAVDLDNNKLYTHINGTYVTLSGNVQNPTNGTHGLDISYGRATNGTVAFGISTRDNYNMYVNFGNGSFNGTALTGTTYSDSNSQGIFKYQPPTNFLALCTNNLNE